MEHRLPPLALAVLVLSGSACGGGTTPTPTPSSTPALQVAGSYATDVSLEENGCGEVTVQPQPTTVTQSTGRVSLTHAGTTYSGPIANDGTFTTDAATVTGAGGETFTITLRGRFTTSGFEARATVDRMRPGAAACRYVVRWVGTKQGAPNVIPG